MSNAGMTEPNLDAIAASVDQAIATFRNERRWLRRFVGLVILVGVLVVLVAVIGWQTRGTTRATNDAVNKTIPGLQRQIADLEDVNKQAVGHVVRLAKEVQRLGGNPGVIEIRPTTTTTAPKE